MTTKKRGRGRPKKNRWAKSPETKLKMKKAALKRWAKKNVKVKHKMSTEQRERIRQVQLKRWDKWRERKQKFDKIVDEAKIIVNSEVTATKVDTCPFCKNSMDVILVPKGLEDFYYCKTCNMIINPIIRWRIKLPDGDRYNKN